MEQLTKPQHKPGLLERHFSGESMHYRQIIALFLPILVDQIFVVGLNLVNTALVSSSGVDAVSAVNMVDSLNMFLISVFIAMATGGTVVVAQYKGSGDDRSVSKAAAASVAAVFLAAAGLGLVLAVLHTPILQLLFGNADPEVLDNARTYLIGSGISYAGIGIVQAVCGALRGVGKSRASLMLSLIMNLTYVLLNVVFIHYMDWGVNGLTVAINIARYAGAACALYYLFRMETTLRLHLVDLFRLQWTMLRRILFIGVPFAAEQLFFNGGKLLTQVFIVSLGTYALATNAIGSTIAGVAQIPGVALSLTLVTVVGQCMGRRDIEDARKFIRSFLWLASSTFVLMAALLIPLFHPLISLFDPPAAIVDDLYTLTLINLVAQIPLWSISFITPAALRAAGDSKFTSLMSMLSMWLFRVILGYILGIVLPFGIIGVWVAMNCEWGVRGAIFLWRYRGDKWYKHKLI
ncbi:MATE family efflux transporter [Gorillibacterium sp. sgz5001074]|uniref:MATE family efflux transporter n=1 Tax=Gorillibacterium sp. sgz5001074 TaxID=3446695 RepID=UPI003F66429A